MPVTWLAQELRCRGIRTLTPDHRVHRRRWTRPRPWRASLGARVAVAGKDLWTRWTGAMQAESGQDTGAGTFFRRVMLAVSWLPYLPSVRRSFHCWIRRVVEKSDDRLCLCLLVSRLDGVSCTKTPAGILGNSSEDHSPPGRESPQRVWQ
jgi:hypothetical protein